MPPSLEPKRSDAKSAFSRVRLNPLTAPVASEIMRRFVNFHQTEFPGCPVPEKVEMGPPFSEKLRKWMGEYDLDILVRAGLASREGDVGFGMIGAKETCTVGEYIKIDTGRLEEIAGRHIRQDYREPRKGAPYVKPHPPYDAG